MQKYFLGLDIGGTKMECALILVTGNDRAISSGLEFRFPGLKGEGIGRIISRQRVPTLRDRGFEAVMCDLIDLIKNVLKSESLHIGQIDGIGVGMPGTIDPVSKIMLNGNSKIFIGQDIVSEIHTRLNCSTHIEVDNDANCFALAETFCGAGLLAAEKHEITTQDLIGIGIILGTGCGGGVVYKGQVLRGKIGGGGEIGHTELVTNGHECYCGRKGCAEQYVSGSAIEREYQERFKRKKLSFDIFDDGIKGDIQSSEIVSNYLDHLARFLINLNNIFDPHFFVLGGGVSNQDTVYSVSQLIHKKTFIPDITPDIYKHQLGDSAGVVGAALMSARDL